MDQAEFNIEMNHLDEKIGGGAQFTIKPPWWGFDGGVDFTYNPETGEARVKDGQGLTRNLASVNDLRAVCDDVAVWFKESAGKGSVNFSLD
ncbi:MAG: hypothetical protein CMH57_02520 [Myxococcales bacterium]|nr:hypothetical protein [Myxococcales bacterium]